MKKIIFLFMALSLLLNACTPAEETPPRLTDEDIQATAISMAWTMAAQTIEAMPTPLSPTATYMPAPTATQTIEAMPTPLSPTATYMPAPTATQTSEDPIPSRIEFSVHSADYEVKVIGVDKPTQIYPGGDFYYIPGEGDMFLDVGIKVSNFTGSDALFKWSDIYITNKYQEKWYPTWGSYKQSNSVLDPLITEIFEFQIHPEVDPDAHFYLDNNGYLRAIFRLPKNNLYYYFGFGDLPLIEIDYRYLNDQPLLKIPIKRR